MVNNNFIKRGDIRYCRLSQIDNSSVQYGLKACIIIQNDIGNTYSGCVNVIPITSKLQKLRLPCHILIHGNRPSVVLTEQLVTIPRDRILNEDPIARLSDHDMKRVKKAIMIQFGFEPIPKGKELFDFQHDYDKKYLIKGDVSNQ